MLLLRWSGGAESTGRGGSYNSFHKGEHTLKVSIFGNFLTQNASQEQFMQHGQIYLSPKRLEYFKELIS
jgi:hypothetical protein